MSHVKLAKWITSLNRGFTWNYQASFLPPLGNRFPIKRYYTIIYTSTSVKPYYSEYALS